MVLKESMATSSSAVSDQVSTVAKTITQANLPHSSSISSQAIHVAATINRNSATLLSNNSAELLSTTPNNYNCTNCDIKFDSESSLRVHLQVSSIVLPFYLYTVDITIEKSGKLKNLSICCMAKVE